MTINSSLDILDKQEAFLSPNSYKTEFENFGCFNPECKSGLGLEVHHIVPRSKGGKDESENYIILCRQCHRGLKNHSNWRKRAVILWTYKFYFESKRRFEGANLLELPINYSQSKENQRGDAEILLPQMSNRLLQQTENKETNGTIRRRIKSTSSEIQNFENIKCFECGISIPQTRPWRKYCSKQCRLKAYEKRHSLSREKIERIKYHVNESIRILRELSL